MWGPATALFPRHKRLALGFKEDTLPVKKHKMYDWFVLVFCSILHCYKSEFKLAVLTHTDHEID